MAVITISSLTSKALRNGDFKDALPEYYALQTVTENGPWHIHQNVFDHVTKVFSAYEKILEFSFLDEEKKSNVIGYLGTLIDTHTYRDILTLTVLLHDIAKTETAIQYSDGSIKCPGHELIGASRMKEFTQRFALSEREAERLERMVRYHGFVSDIVDRIAQTENLEHENHLFAQTVGDIALDLMLFIYADLQGCDLDQTKPELYKKYEQIQIDCIQKFLNSHL